MTPPRFENRILVVMPTERDAERTSRVLADAGMDQISFPDVGAMCAEFLTHGGAAMLLTEEVLSSDAREGLELTLKGQPTWATIPVLVIVRETSAERIPRGGLGGYPSVTIIERPVRTRSLVAALESALRGRRNQYQVRDALRAQARQAVELAAQDEKLRAALATLSEQAERLRTTDRLKDEFLATLAHELRNPLAPISAGLSVLERSSDPRRAQRTLGVMRRQVNHMVRLIDDLLDVARITRGKLELKLERFAVKAAIDAAIEASLPNLVRGNHRLHTDITETPLYVEADLTRVAQIVGNLLNNAAKYTPSAGNIHLVVRRDGDAVLIEVKDDGMGIPPERLEDIFQMFGQVNQSLDRAQGGLGIGLALVRRLVEMHQGTVTAKSDGPGKGSTFSVRLPAARAPVVTPIPTTERPVVGSSRRVLVVDDNEDAGELLGFMLEQEGFEAVIVNDGPAALRAAASVSPSVVILDIGLPGMSGYEVAKQLREQSSMTDTAIIALSGWGSPEDKRRALDAGFDLHLTKPVFLEELRQALGAVTPAAWDRHGAVPSAAR
jgi:signal transduction histidine kinase/ActR/RegA family two-component response regulator